MLFVLFINANYYNTSCVMAGQQGSHGFLHCQSHGFEQRHRLFHLLLVLNNGMKKNTLSTNSTQSAVSLCCSINLLASLCCNSINCSTSLKKVVSSSANKSVVNVPLYKSFTHKHENNIILELNFATEPN